ncbi:MAG: PPOX class F420-dependent oxidoreductase [Acidimicrobiales bacterium]
MELAKAITFGRVSNQGALITIRRDGRPQISNIIYKMEEDGSTRISVTADRAKTKNLRRDQRAELYVAGSSFWHYAVFDGTAQLSPVAEAPDDPVVEELVGLYRSIRGEDHPNWDEYRQAMVDERRMVCSFQPSSAYGQVQ